MTLIKIEKKLSLLDFAREHGKMKVAPFVNKETGEPFKACAFVDNDNTITIVTFSSKLGELTPKEIANNKGRLVVLKLSSGSYKLVPKDIVYGKWREYIVNKYTAVCVERIHAAIDTAQKSKGEKAIDRYLAGVKLHGTTQQLLEDMSDFLPKTDLRYQTIADKLGLEILQCGIDYFGDSDEADAALKAMSLLKYANSIVVGQMAKDRCKENVDILQKIIDNLPPSEVFAEDKAIKEELHKYCQLPDKICHAVTLLNNTRPHLMSIKQKMGVDNAYYLKISTQVVGNALHNIIEEVNEAQKYDPAKERRIRQKMFEEDSPFKQRLSFGYPTMDDYLYESTDRREKYKHIQNAVLKAREALLLMDSLDMEKDFEQERYLPNRNTLDDMLVKFGNPLPKYKPVPITKKIAKETRKISEELKRVNTKDLCKQTSIKAKNVLSCIKKNAGLVAAIVVSLFILITGICLGCLDVFRDGFGLALCAFAAMSVFITMLIDKLDL